MTVALSPIQASLNQQAGAAPKTGSYAHAFMPNARAHGAFRRDHHLALKPALKAPLKTSLKPPLRHLIRPERPAWPNMPATLADSYVFPFQSTQLTSHDWR